MLRKFVLLFLGAVAVIVFFKAVDVTATNVPDNPNNLFIGLGLIVVVIILIFFPRRRHN
jgi:hypothetical protein